MKRVIGYVAVGSAEDVKSGQGLVIQRQRVEEYCQEHGLTLLIIHHDTPYSSERGLQRAAEHLSAGIAEAVVYFNRSTNQPTILAA